MFQYSYIYCSTLGPKRSQFDTTINENSEGINKFTFRPKHATKAFVQRERVT